MLDLPVDATRAQLLDAIKDIIVGKGGLRGPIPSVAASLVRAQRGVSCEAVPGLENGWADDLTRPYLTTFGFKTLADAAGWSPSSCGRV